MQRFNQEEFNKFNTYFWVKSEYNKIETDYIKKTEKHLNIIKFFPWIRLVAIVNSLSMKAASEESDIDLFIVTTSNSMWLNRFLITLYFSLFWLRKTKSNHAGKFCLSFFMTDNNLDFKNIALKDDIYLYFWIIYLKPIINNNDSYDLFLNQNKSWASFIEYQNIIKENKKIYKI